MNKIILYFLIPIMLLQSNMTLLITTSFYYNQNYIEKYLCVQRKMEHNNCHGQCYLAKKLKQQQEKEQQSFKVNLHEAVNSAIVIFNFLRPWAIIVYQIEFNLFEPNFYQLKFANKVFRPPLAFCD